EAVRLNPQFAEAYFNRATPRLLQGDFLGGWADYEWRWRRPAYPPPPFRQPLWDGSPLAGKTILLWAEQGLGDTFQFIRYAPLVKERGGNVIVACQAAVTRLLRSCAGIDRLIAKENAAATDFDVYAPLMSLPAIFKTTLTTIPAAVPYLAADAKLVEHWREQLGSCAGLKIGIAWQGNPEYGNDRQRSLPLTCFEPLSRLAGVQLISLQKGPGIEQLQDVKGRWPIVDFTAKLDEAAGAFQDTAAIMSNLDLVISSDSAVAHLAGALGVPVWLALPWLPDFRWFVGRDDCPWYPTMRLFRQTQSGRWDDVFERIAQAVKPLAA
ncbi:MAG TPA: hypothetical protein VE988_14230, partial [Gemmataceae bacterium]|nr:hypothetical protein [Gemmataceae bacterium]